MIDRAETLHTAFYLFCGFECQKSAQSINANKFLQGLSKINNKVLYWTLFITFNIFKHLRVPGWLSFYSHYCKILGSTGKVWYVDLWNLIFTLGLKISSNLVKSGARLFVIRWRTAWCSSSSNSPCEHSNGSSGLKSESPDVKLKGIQLWSDKIVPTKLFRLNCSD